VDTCTTTTYGGPDGSPASVPGVCSDKAGNVSGASALALKYDDTAPVVTGGQPGRAADANGWYNRPVSITFDGTDQTAGVDSCTNATYSGPDSGTASLAGRCTDRAGNLSPPFPFGLRYDAAGPVVTAATPGRAPDANGWYNHAVEFVIDGTDATSGVAACPPVSYGGPDSATGAVTGQCRDRAGNLSSRDFALKYDGTAPKTTDVVAGRSPNGAGWYNRPVSFAFRGTDQTAGVDECTSTLYAGPDSATASLAGTCTDNAGGPLSLALKYDETAPEVTGAAAGRAPNGAGWYNRPVSVGFSGSDLTSGIDACSTETYSGPDSVEAKLAGTCTDRAGNASGTLSFGLKYDETEPAVTDALAERPPDHGDWFTKPVRFEITGTDAMSGLLECPPVIYSGPDSRAAALIGRCSDRAGNSSSRAFPLSFDATAPPLTDLKASPGDRRVELSWHTPPDAELVQVVRTPGVGLDPATVLFRGLDVIFVDTRVDNGVRYAYEVRVQDAAGNADSKTVTTVPTATAPPQAVGVVGTGEETAPPGNQSPAPTAQRRGLRLIAPPAGALVRAGHPLLLRWTPVPGARYYNLQLFRRGKILSVWPSRPLYQLKRRWSYRGERQRLAPGHYHWIVWPGFGPRSETNYGKRIGRSAFEVRLRAPLAAMSAAEPG
jgi:hypothetical protein